MPNSTGGDAHGERTRGRAGVFGAGIAVALALGGCAAPADPAAGGEPSTTDRPASGFAPATTWTFDLAESDGDAIRVVLSLTRFATLADARRLPSGQGADQLDDCGLDPARDMVAAGTFTVTNMNSSMTLDAGFYLGAVDRRRPDGDETPISVLAYYPAGPACIRVSDWNANAGQRLFALSPPQPQAPGESVAVEFYLIVDDVLSPTAPAGDAAVFAELFLIAYLDPVPSSVGGPWTATSLTGPVDGSRYDDVTWLLLPLAPLAPT